VKQPKSVTFAVGSRLRLDGKGTSWLVRACTSNQRYFLATCAIFGKVYYTIIDMESNIRGSMNISGGGLGIFSTSGKDENIDEAIGMLEESMSNAEKYFKERPENKGKIAYCGEWEVSHRNRVPLKISYIKNAITPIPKKPKG
jgi:hypothetical protein